MSHRDQMKDEQEFRRIARWLARTPDREPPEDFVWSVMRAVQCERLVWWRRWRRWVMSPKSITFTPFRVAPVMAALVGICAISGLLLFKWQGGSLDGAGRPGLRPIHFTLTLPKAHSVAVIGTFNQWQAQGFEMKPAGAAGGWALEVWLPAGRYEYAFLVDGRKIIPDPKAFILQDDGFGQRNAVLILGKQNERTI